MCNDQARLRPGFFYTDHMSALVGRIDVVVRLACRKSVSGHYAKHFFQIAGTGAQAHLMAARADWLGCDLSDDPACPFDSRVL